MSAPDDNRCPQCKGTLVPTYLGELSDKHLRCEYCGHVVDVLDESSVTHEETVSYTDEHGNRVHKTRRVIRERSDRVESDSFPGRDLPEREPRAVFQRLDGREVWVDIEAADAFERLNCELDYTIDDVSFADIKRQVREHIAAAPRRAFSDWDEGPHSITETITMDGPDIAMLLGADPPKLDFVPTGAEPEYEPEPGPPPQNRHKTVDDLAESIRAQARRSRRASEAHPETRGRGKLVLGIAVGVVLSLVLSWIF